ncbi:hypothetical protein AMECASPLE_017875 [Ameca splendens]|uniref:Uncharacterized protein n=1 Tax=Ameca splendens TaxID=208324 RepID=A0ABV0ZD41_9TELE
MCTDAQGRRGELVPIYSGDWAKGGVHPGQEEAGVPREYHENSMQEDPRPGFKPRTFLLRGNSATNCNNVQTFSREYSAYFFNINLTYNLSYTTTFNNSREYI